MEQCPLCNATGLPGNFQHEPYCPMYEEPQPHEQPQQPQRRPQPLLNNDNNNYQPNKGAGKSKRRYAGKSRRSKKKYKGKSRRSKRIYSKKY